MKRTNLQRTCWYLALVLLWSAYGFAWFFECTVVRQGRAASQAVYEQAVMDPEWKALRVDGEPLVSLMKSILVAQHVRVASWAGLGGMVLLTLGSLAWQCKATRNGSRTAAPPDR